MTIAILATGDELIHGDTLNTNGHMLAQILSSEGFSLGLQVMCGDKEAEILRCMRFLAEQHDIIIVMGGLGPTTDDVTRFALGQLIAQPLVSHQDALDHIKQRLQKTDAMISAGNKRQCFYPEHAILLANPNGTALGCFYQHHNTLFFLLPGPPRECLPMFRNEVMPLLQNKIRSSKHILKWRIFGVAESEIAQLLEEALEPFPCHTGYRWDAPYIEFKVRCNEEWITPIKEAITPLLAPHIIATVEQKASDKLHEQIRRLNRPITIIDEVTGGLLESLIIKPDIHHLVSFHQSTATRVTFHLRGLEEYWSGQGPQETTNVVIHYSNQQQEGKETHSLPYRSAMVVLHAAEWLSFRLVHLINQLH